MYFFSLFSRPFLKISFRCPVHAIYVFCWINFTSDVVVFYDFAARECWRMWSYWGDEFSSTAMEDCSLAEYVSKLGNYLLPCSPPFTVFMLSWMSLELFFLLVYTRTFQGFPSLTYISHDIENLCLSLVPFSKVRLSSVLAWVFLFSTFCKFWDA